MAAQQLSDGNGDGVALGQSGDSVTVAGSSGSLGFFGGTPATKYSTSVATGTDTATTQTAVNAVLAALERYGLIVIND